MHAVPRTILVTGATGGIGLAVRDRLSKGGASLLLAARDVPKLQSLCTQWPHNGSGRHAWIRVDMTSDESIQQFADELAARNVNLDGVVLMPPQDPPTSDPLPSSAKWREILQNSFVGPLALLKVAIGTMKPDPANGRRCKIVIISGDTSTLAHRCRCGWGRPSHCFRAVRLDRSMAPVGRDVQFARAGAVTGLRRRRTAIKVRFLSAADSRVPRTSTSGLGSS